MHGIPSFLHYVFIVIIIIISVNIMYHGLVILMGKNDYVHAIFEIRPLNSKSEVPSVYLGHIRNLHKCLILLISSKVVVRGPTPTLLILNFLEILKYKKDMQSNGGFVKIHLQILSTYTKK